ncbi:MAG: transporter substrate-binding domain-containing protein [Desulfobacterales bacterium]|nr:transporter substrate-binding domain-containing protein [Desulfobacterales bacterium]MCP4163414.1 transporter substrate-binding domain-containing protein [Deltaproteobacteria bacterium]
MKILLECIRKISVILFFTIYATNSFADEKICITSGEWAPYISKELKYYGVASRIVSEAFALEGVKVVYKFYPWKRSYIEAHKGKCNSSIGWTKKTDREAIFMFSDEPVIIGQSVFFHLKKKHLKWDPYKQNYENLRGFKVGMLFGEVNRKEFENAVTTGIIRVEKVGSLEQNFKKMILGRIQLITTDKDVGYDIINKKISPDKIKLFTHTISVPDTTKYYLILSKKNKRNKKFMILFNRGLKKLKASGKYDQYYIESRQGKYLIKK